MDQRREANRVWWLAALAELRVAWAYKRMQAKIKASTTEQIERALRAFRAFCKERGELEPTTAAFNEWVSTGRASQSKLVHSALSGLGQAAHPGWKKGQAVVQAVKEARPHHAYRKETLLSLWTAMKAEPRWKRLVLAQQCLFYLALRRQDLVTITVGDWSKATRHGDTKTYELPPWVEEKTRGKKKKKDKRRGRGIPEGLHRDVARYQEEAGLGPEAPMLGWVTVHAFGQHFNKWRHCFFTEGRPRPRLQELEGIQTHDFRASFVTRGRVILGRSLALLQREVGHEDVKVTDGYVKDYVDVLPRKEKLPRTLWEDWLVTEEARGGKESGGESG